LVSCERLGKFKRRHIVYRTLAGESRGVDLEAVEDREITISRN
jgi:hypothetical protein